MGLLTAGGLVEARADWTASAKTNLVNSVRNELQAKDHQFLNYVRSASSPESETQLVKLNETVGQSILIHGYGGLSPQPLPNKKGKFDWSLGSGVRDLNTAYGADYALFIYSNGSYASGGRVATGILMAALFGANVQMGRQVAFASLVDLRSGDVVWFNVAGTTAADPRKDTGAATLAKSLLKDIPL